MHNRRKCGATLLAFLVCALGPFPAQAQNKDAVELVHADRVTLEQLPVGNAYLAEGSVHFRQGPSQLYADRAVWFEKTNEVHLFGHVRVSDTTESLSCDTLYYYKATELANAYGHVEYTKPAEQLKATSRSGVYHRLEHRAELYDDALMVQHPDDDRRTETWADTLVFNSTSRSGEARGHVRVVRSDGTVTAGQARFESSEIDDHIVFLGSPSCSIGGNEVSGDSLVLTLRTSQMKSLDALGNARARFQERAAKGRTTTSDIKSDRIAMAFDEGQLEEMVATGQAEVRYVPAWGRENERNDASGDTVKITLADSTVQRVQVISGALGTYFNPQGDSADSTARIDTIKYGSSYIDYKVDKNAIRLFDHAEVTYGDVHLEAGQVVYQTDAAVLRAYALDDTLLPRPAEYVAPQTPALPDSARVELPADTLHPIHTISDSTEFVAQETGRQRPVLHEGSQVVDGERLVYDIPTRRGRIVGSYTAAQDGYYSGGDFRLESPKTFYVENGSYTTCDLDEPHFDFSGGRMKVREGDRVIARPVVMHIEQVPVLWLPYYVFSIKPDRHSGMLPLRFGNFERGSRYVRNIGYYFAVSDYWDVAPALDVVEGEGVLWHVLTSYALRYKLSGSFFGSYNKHTAVTTQGEQTTTRWNALFSHSQEISPTATLSGSGNFVSDNSFYQDFTADPNFRLNRRLRSQLNFNKRWQSSSFILAVDDSRNLDDDSRESILPRYALSLPQRQIFVPGHLKGGQTEEARWYHQFRAGFTSVGQNLLSENVIGQTKRGKHHMTADHRFDLNFSGKAGPIALTPGLSMEETWYYVYAPTNDTLPGKVDTLPAGIEAEQFYRRLSGSFRVAAQTNMYGIFNIQRGGLLGFRHVFTPSLSLSLSPAVTENTAVRLYTGVGGGGPRSTVLSGGLGNLFQMKTRSGDSERLWDLLNVGMSGSYNFDAPSHRMSFISTSIRSGLVRNPDLSLSLTHDPYDPVTGAFDWSPRLASITTAVTFRLSGKGGVPGGSSVGEGGYYETSGGADIEGSNGNLGGFNSGTSNVRSWDFSASYQFAETRTPNPLAKETTIKSITHWVRPNFRFNPTPFWDIQTNLYYDIVKQTMNDWTIRLHRDLHCWEAEFSWVVTGARAGYYFRINVKRLSSLKFEKSESGLRDALFGALPGT